MKAFYIKRIGQSGSTIGLKAQKIANDVDDVRQQQTADLHSSDLAKAKEAQATLAKNVHMCEALPIFEILDKKHKTANR